MTNYLSSYSVHAINLLKLPFSMAYRSQEPQVLDYFVQQYKLFPAIAETYAVYFAQKFMLERYQHLDETEIKFNNFKSLPEVRELISGKVLLYKRCKT